MDTTQADLIATVRAGASLDEAATQVGVNIHTLRRWLSTGRKAPDGPYGDLAKAIDRIRATPSQDPTLLARRFITAYATYQMSAGDNDGRAMGEALSAITSSRDAYKVIIELAQHFLVATYRQIDNTNDLRAAARPAVEELFIGVDIVAALPKRA